MKNRFTYFVFAWFWFMGVPTLCQELVIPTNDDWKVIAKITGDGGELNVQFINPKGGITRRRNISLPPNSFLVNGLNLTRDCVVLLTISEAVQGGYKVSSHRFSQIGESYNSKIITHVRNIPKEMKMLERGNEKLDVIWSDEGCRINEAKEDYCNRKGLFAFSIVEISFYYPMMRSYSTRQ